MSAESVAGRTGLTPNYVKVLLHRGILESYEESEIRLLRKAVELRDRHLVPLKNGMAMLREGLCPLCGNGTWRQS